MAPLSATQLSELASKLQSLLASTPYACTSLSQLTGGTTSFVFLGTLSQPNLNNGKKEDHIILKYAAPFASCHTEFPVDANRATYEAHMLHALQTFTPPPSPHPHPTHPRLTIKTPKPHLYNEAEKLQIIQHIPSTVPLTTALRTLPTHEAHAIGHALGHWLRAFHTHTSSALTRGLDEEISRNGEVVGLKFKLNWGQGSSALQFLSSGGLIAVGEEESKAWDAARGRAEAEMQGVGSVNVGVVHGDLWAGNVLVPIDTLKDHLDLHVIDFEFAHRACRSTDIGQFIGHLIERCTVDPTLQPLADETIRGFVGGYGKVDDEMRWRTAIYVGVYVVNWWSRGPPGRKDQSDEIRGRAVELVKQGLEWVRAGWSKDAAAFLNTPLQVLFEI